MKRLLLLLLLLGAFWPSVAIPPSDVEAYLVHQRLYNKAEHHVQYGNAEQRLQAALFFGARRNPRYVRLLAKELLQELDPSDPYFNMPRNAPVVKSYLAWALGHIGHTKAVPYLLKALDTVSKTLAEESKRIAQAKEDEKQRYAKDANTKTGRGVINDDPVRRIILEKRRPGPYLEGKEHALPYSPDVYWSLSNEFREMMAPDLTDSNIRVRLMGFNWVNTAFYIFDAIGDIYMEKLHKDRIDPEHANAVGKYLALPNYDFIRGAAAVCLGKIGSPKAIALLESAYESEKDTEVRAKIAHAILRNDRGKTKFYLDLLKYLADDQDNVRFPAAVALRDLKMGESLVPLQEAHAVENVASIREILAEAIEQARIDNLRVPD